MAVLELDRLGQLATTGKELPASLEFAGLFAPTHSTIFVDAALFANSANVLAVAADG